MSKSGVIFPAFALKRSRLIASVSLLACFVSFLACKSGNPTQASVNQLQAKIGEVTSERVVIAWRAVRRMTSGRIFISPEPNSMRMQVATLAADATSAELANLAPGARVFIRLEVNLPSGIQTSEFSVRTLIPPNTSSAVGVRSVHMMTPRILNVVLANGNGETWESSSWVIERNNGQRIPVESVHRHSTPVAQPNYEVGYGAHDELEPTMAEHRIFLTLAQAVGEREILRIRGPNDVEFLLPFSDRYLETPVIQLNQVGYNPRATKRWAYISGWMGDGGGVPLSDFPNAVQIIKDAESDKSARAASRERDAQIAITTLPITQRSMNDDDAGSEVKQIDLSPLPGSTRGRLRIRIPGVGVSWPTQISELAAFKAFYVVTRGLFHNRWAGDLNAKATEWTRPADHTEVFTAESTHVFDQFGEQTPKVGKRPLRGGYHDAGDFDQRPCHTVVPQVLMRAYELNPELYTDRQLTLPESGNGIPDILDEALWGIGAWIALQESDGGVRAGAESWRHPLGIYFAHQDELPYWTFARDAKVSARAAGLFAQASRLISRFDRNRAEKLQNAAERAWKWAIAHSAPPAFKLYGASELYRLTQKQEYADAARSLWSSFGPQGVFSLYALDHLQLNDYARDGRVMSDYFLGYLQSNGAPAELIAEAKKSLEGYADLVVEHTFGDLHAHRNPRPGNRGFGWGQPTIMGRYYDPILARLQLGDVSEEKRQAYFDTMSVGADFVLGANPLGMVFITGLGTRSPQEPLHLDSLAWLKNGRPVVPGIPVYGPVSALPNAYWYDAGKAAFHPKFEDAPPMFRYGDIRSFVNTNEFSVWEAQAPHAEHFAVLIGARMRPPSSWLPGGNEHAATIP